MKLHQPELQVVLDQARFDLPGDAARRKAELLREFGPEGEALAAQLQAAGGQHEATDLFFRESHDLPPDSFLEGWNLKGKVKQHPGLEAPLSLVSDHRAAALLRELRPFLTYQLEAPTPVAQTRALSQAITTPGRFPNGREGLRELLAKKLQDLGGDALVGEDQGFVVEHLSFEGSKLVGLQVVQSENIYRGACIVAATDAGALRRLIAGQEAAAEARRAARPLRDEEVPLRGELGRARLGDPARDGRARPASTAATPSSAPCSCSSTPPAPSPARTTTGCG